MLFLSSEEADLWRHLGECALSAPCPPKEEELPIPPERLPMFRFHCGALLAAEGEIGAAMEWFRAGAMVEAEDAFTNTFFAAFLQRQGGRFSMPCTVFSDPVPYVHFTTVPAIRGARQTFLRWTGMTLPRFARPFRFLDIGCGDGGLTVELLQALLSAGKIATIGEIVLVDSSPAMLEMAERKISEAFPAARVTPIRARIQDVSDSIPDVDVALASLSIHHMPFEDKRLHLGRLQSKMNHFLLFELDANHDAPELFAPELSFSVYQSYGRMVDAVFAHDAHPTVANACVDQFLLAEVISILTQPRGKRTEYHMLRNEWGTLFGDALPEFRERGGCTTYAHPYLDLVALHYGRN